LAEAELGGGGAIGAGSGDDGGDVESVGEDVDWGEVGGMGGADVCNCASGERDAFEQGRLEGDSGYLQKSVIYSGAMAGKKKAKKVEEPERMEKKETRKASTWRRLMRGRLTWIVGLAALAGLLYYYRGLFVVAIVEGKPITRLALVRELEAQAGKGALDSLVTEALIEQRAKELGLSILPKEVDEKIAGIEEELSAQGQELDQMLVAQGMDRTDLARQVRLQMMVEKIVVDRVQVSDEEIAEYIEQYSSFFPEEMAEEEKQAGAKEQVQQQKLAENFYSWLEEAKAEADITYFVEY